MTASGEPAEHKIEFKANPVQQDFIESRATADLFSSRMGEGKSAALVWAAFYFTRYNPGARGAIIRDTWENLRDTTQKEFFKWFPPGIMGSYKDSTKTFSWGCEGLSGEVVFIGMDDPKDASKLMSRDLAYFCIDEPAPAQGNGGVDELVFDIGLSRLRQSGMKWYSAKLAENNPDETHWTYRRFVNPGTNGFRTWQPKDAENSKNLPSEYYRKLRALWAHRPDLQRRFIDGRFGFQQIGKPITPEWNDEIHLATGLAPLRGSDLVLLWDFGLNPTCVITQPTPLGNWHGLESMSESGIGVMELIEAVVGPRLAKDYRGFAIRHIGDPAGVSPEQSSSANSAVRVIKKLLGGPWQSGPSSISARVDPLRAVLRQVRNGTGLLRVDRDRCAHVWHALRGGWHRHVNREGVVATDPLKNEHSHPGDCMGYGAARLFPLGRLEDQKATKLRNASGPMYFRTSAGLGFERPGMKMPTDTRALPAKE